MTWILNDFKTLLEEFCELGGIITYGKNCILTAGTRNTAIHNYGYDPDPPKQEPYIILNLYLKRYDNINDIILYFHRNNLIEEISKK